MEKNDSTLIRSKLINLHLPNQGMFELKDIRQDYYAN